MMISTKYALTIKILVGLIAILASQQNAATAADKTRVAFSAVSPTQGVLWVADVGGFLAKNVSRRRLSTHAPQSKL